MFPFLQQPWPMHAQGEGEFASVVEIVLDDVPDDPLMRDTGVTSRECLPEVGGRPAGESALDHVPGYLKTVD